MHRPAFRHRSHKPACELVPCCGSWLSGGMVRPQWEAWRPADRWLIAVCKKVESPVVGIFQQCFNAEPVLVAEILRLIDDDAVVEVLRQCFVCQSRREGHLDFEFVLVTVPRVRLGCLGQQVLPALPPHQVDTLYIAGDELHHQLCEEDKVEAATRAGSRCRARCGSSGVGRDRLRSSDEG